MNGNYVQSQYSTPSSRDMIRRWVRDADDDSESVARYMRDVLRIGGIRICRQIIAEAHQEIPPIE